MQARIVLELVRNQTQTAVIGAWVSHEARRSRWQRRIEVRAAQVALEGVQKEAQGGQRTTSTCSTPSRISPPPARG